MLACKVLLSLFSTFLRANTIIEDCPDDQEYDTHLICKIFTNTNIDDIFWFYNFSDIDYCDWDDDDIYCSNGNTITHLNLRFISLNGTLNLTNLWPPNLIEIDLDQNAETDLDRISLRAEWNWESIKLLTNIKMIEIDYNAVRYYDNICIYYYQV